MCQQDAYWHTGVQLKLCGWTDGQTDRQKSDLNCYAAHSSNCATMAPFSKAAYPSMIVCFYLTYWKLLKLTAASNAGVYEQELSYRKQIARKLRTQFVEGISVTLKSTLRVTQDHWKGNHWTDHTRHDELLDAEYYCDLEMWVRGYTRSLKVVPFESLGAVF